MSLLQYYSPEARFYQRDRDIMDNYDTRITAYNKALEEYKPKAAEYQNKIDAFNTEVAAYNKALDDWKAQAEAYNASIEKWNATDRTTPYTEWSGTVAAPGAWNREQPVFSGGEAPVAPEDPGFTGEDVDKFVAESRGRAIRRGEAGAAARNILSDPGNFFSGGVKNTGTTPSFSFAGMSGFGSSAMGFAEGGPVPDLPFANSIKPGQMATMAIGEEMGGGSTGQNLSDFLNGLGANTATPATGGGGQMMTMAFGEEASAPPVAATEMPGSRPDEAMRKQLAQLAPPNQVYQQTLQQEPTGMPQPTGRGRQGPSQQGIGGLFEAQFGRQIADLQGSPLTNYKNYLMGTYGTPTMKEVQNRVDEFVDLVDQAERAHFGAQESFGYGGGSFHQNLMSQFQPQQSPYGQQQNQDQMKQQVMSMQANLPKPGVF